MHPYEAKIQAYLDSLGPNGMEQHLIEAASLAFAKAMNKSFNDEHIPNPMRLSAIGKPECQLLAERDGMAKEPMPYNHKIRMLYGNIVEALFVAIIKASGINVQSEQDNVEYHLYSQGKQKQFDVPGTYDVEIDGAIWDVKSASPWSYKNKFKDYKTVADGDYFGYSAQLFMYAIASGKKVGGWIVIDKSSGEFKVIEVPEEIQSFENARLTNTTISNVLALDSGTFKRCFEPVEETWHGKPTGNKYLQMPCTMCEFKWSCWPGLEYTRAKLSKAKDPEWLYYVKNEVADDHQSNEN